MTLPASGPLAFSDIQVEFSGANPIALTEYYGRASGIPASGQISVSQFYGKSAATNTITPAGIFGSSTVIGYQSSPVFGAISPANVGAQTIVGLYDRNDGSSPVHQFWLELGSPGLPQSFFTSVSFTDKNGIARIFRSNGTGFTLTSFGTIGSRTAWHWNADPAGTGLFFNTGVAYPLVIV